MSKQIYATDNDVEIIDLMTDAGIKHLDNDTSRVLTFVYNGDYHVILFISTPSDRGYLMFIIQDLRNNSDQASQLITMFQEFVKVDNNAELMIKAIDDVTLLQDANYVLSLLKM